MRIATYNQQYGWSAQAFSSLRELYWHYLRKSGERIEAGASIAPTLEMIEKVNPDVIALQEVFGDSQAHQIKQELRQKGFQSFALGNGRRFCSTYQIYTLIASKELAQHISFSSEGVFGKTHDGGFSGLHFSEFDLSLATVHLPFSHLRRLKVFGERAEKILENTSDSRCVIFGDFNSSHKHIMRHVPHFKSWEKISPHEKTCSTASLLRHVFKSDLDHMMAKGVRAKDSGTLHGASDHKLVWADLEF